MEILKNLPSKVVGGNLIMRQMFLTAQTKYGLALLNFDLTYPFYIWHNLQVTKPK